ncbi:ATP-grasp domain-containing protein [Bacillus sp. FDAARGOS_1420]|uniref:ATP-grasp domain-containing protein n=1 Tax=unclassified Bacillus (in: firmicutes) TaxID=185979 RepID=UPI001C5AE118|nr:ATP-grasp domain-containing protein [Bacillus sp. FDAARGOS_1420]MBW3496531.1 ATP-grasp domain-containing protein [Bacillus sp. FDAARGOS_1420]
MKILILFARRNAYLLDITYQHALNKGHEVYVLNTYKEGSKNNSTIFSNPNPFIAIAQELHVDAVVCLSTERTLERDALIKKNLENKGITVIANPLELIKTLAYKEEAKKFFFQNEIPTSQGGVVKNKHELEELVNRLGFPLVTKKSRAAGGKGNRILQNYNDIKLFTSERNCFDEDIVVEKFINGIELSMEIVGENGKYIFMPLIYQGTTNINGEHPTKRWSYTPYNEEEIKKSMQIIALKIARKLNLCGSAELEVVWEPHSNLIYVLEVNPRLNGNTLLGMAHTNLCVPTLFIDMADNTWSANSESIVTDKRSIVLDLRPDLSKNIINKVNSLSTFFNFRRNKDGRCVNFILSGNTEDVILDMEIVKSLGVSSQLKDTIDFQNLLRIIQK